MPARSAATLQSQSGAPAADEGSVVPARVERIRGPNGRPRWRLIATLLGDEQGPFSAGDLSFLSVDESEPRPLPLRVITIEQTAFTLVIEAEPFNLSGHLHLRAALVVLRGPSLGGAGAPAPYQVVNSIDYLARDFDSFRTLLLDRITSLAPTWTDTTSADLGVMLVEVLAYLADNLSYFQDAIATEAYLTKARRRMSVRRHVRLLDYWLGQGVGARVWVRFDAGPNVTGEIVQIPAGTKLLACPGGHPVVVDGTTEYLQQRALATGVFETMTTLHIDPLLAQINLDDHGRRQFVVAAGATSVEVFVDGALNVGDVLMFESRSPTALPPHPVRLTACKQLGGGRVAIQWSSDDAPTRDLPVTQIIAGVVERNLTVLRGNVVLADFGETTRSTLPTRTDTAVPYEPLLPYSIVSFGSPAPSSLTPAVECTSIPGQQVCAAIVLHEGCDQRFLGGFTEAAPTSAAIAEVSARGPLWKPVPDLLLSGPYSRVFVVEAQEEGTTLRFGDGVFGRSPPLGAWFVARFRVGDTADSNVGARAITTIVAGAADPVIEWIEAGLQCNNPLAAAGGSGPETLPHAKQAATGALQQVNAAITLDDYATIARRVSGVGDATALLAWTGSWFTTFVYLRVTGADPACVLQQAERALAQARAAGRAIVVREPVWVALAVTLRIRLASGFGAEAVRAALRDAFVAEARGARPAGFFDPTRWSFGETVWASAIITWAQGVRGVKSAELRRLARADGGAGGAPAPDRLEMAANELPQVQDVPFQPQTGTLVLKFVTVDEVWT